MELYAEFSRVVEVGHVSADSLAGETATHRFWLITFDSNARAQRVYEKLGFSRDGALREAYLGTDRRRRDPTLMALLRPEWEARTAAAPQDLVEESRVSPSPRT